ncbi:MAG: GNAT family N-acetyltransferase [Arenimonas sp.]
MTGNTLPDNPVLDNIFWHALSGPHARFSLGTATARRFAPGFSPILGFADALRPDFAAIAPFCAAGEHFYIAQWAGATPDGWQVDFESTMFKMVWDGRPPPEDHAADARPLQPEHAQQALTLALLTNPGPFGLRTIELGEYFGLFEGERLVAMAGERMAAGTMREISGVCTHPDFQGRGHARRLVDKLVRRQVARGETPFLHVMSTNAAGHGLYSRMGFADYREAVVRVVSPVATP